MRGLTGSGRGFDSISSSAIAEETHFGGRHGQQRLFSAHVLDMQAEVEQKDPMISVRRDCRCRSCRSVRAHFSAGKGT